MLANRRELVLFAPDGSPQRRETGEFKAAAGSAELAVTADERRVRVYRLPDLVEQAAWDYDEARGSYGCEGCQAGALAVHPGEVWLAFSEERQDHEESRFMDPAFTTEYYLRLYTPGGELRRTWTLPSPAAALAVVEGRCWVGMASGALALATHTGLEVGSPGPARITQLHASAGGLWVGRADGSVERRGLLDGQLQRRLTARGNPVTALLLKKRLWVGHQDGRLVQRHPDTLARITSTSQLGPVGGLAALSSQVLAGASYHLTPHPPGRLEGHRGFLESLAFSPDGRELVSASYDESLRAWEVASGRELAIFQGHRGPVRAVAVDGSRVVSGGKDGTVRLWNRRGLAQHCHRASSKSFDEKPPWSRGGEPVSALSVHGDLAERRILFRQQVAGGSVRALAFSPDGSQLLVASEHRAQLRTLDGQVLAEVARIYSHYSSAGWQAEGAQGVIGNWDGELYLFEGTTKPRQRKVPGNFLAGVGYAGGHLVTATSGEGLVRWDARGRRLTQAPLASAPICIATHGSLVAVGLANTTVQLFTPGPTP